jgi:hypothetical protein
MIQQAHVSAQDAATVSAGTFPPAVDPDELQRVANAMYARHLLARPFNVHALTG